MLPKWGNNMKMPDIFSAKPEYVRDFKPNRNLTLMKRVRICNRLIRRLSSSYFRDFKHYHNLPLMERFRICNRLIHRTFSPLEKEIDMETLYQIVGHVDKEHSEKDPHNAENHPIDRRKTIPNITLFDWDSYINRINEKAVRYGFENHITTEEDPADVLISEKDKYYYPRYKITVKNLIINAHDSKRGMFFYPFLPDDPDCEEEGIYLIFENNRFVGKDHWASPNFAEFYPKENAYFVFKNNEFISVDLYLRIERLYKIEIKGNIFTNSNVEISMPLGVSFDANSVICIDDNISYRKYKNSSKFTVYTGNCYFKGKNTVDNLILSLESLHWGGYQNIDPQGKHAYIHKKMFIGFMEKAIQKNDKMQEIRLRRELMKCERALLSEEKIWHSLQDKFILWWSGLVSDYGISWLRPFLWLLTINALFATIVYFSPSQYPSWLSLFVKFFNPLNNLSNAAGITDNTWISLIAILQKAFLGVFLYEMIKIFRRFSK